MNRVAVPVSLCVVFAAVALSTACSGSLPTGTTQRMAAQLRPAATRGASSSEMLYVMNEALNAQMRGSIVEYSLTGTTPVRSIRRGIDHPDNVTVTPAGYLYVANRNTNTTGSVTAYAPGSTTPSFRIDPPAPSSLPGLIPSSLAASSKGRVFVGYLNAYAYQHGTLREYPPASATASFRKFPLVKNPFFLAVNQGAHLYVGDSEGAYRRSIQEYVDRSSVPILQFGMRKLNGLTVDGTGDIYAIEGRDVDVYDATGALLWKVHHRASVCAIALGPTDILYVASCTIPGSVYVYAPHSTKVIRAIHLTYGAIALATASDGMLFVATYVGDNIAHTVTVYASGGTKLLRTISTGITSPGVLAVGPGV